MQSEIKTVYLNENSKDLRANCRWIMSASEVVVGGGIYTVKHLPPHIHPHLQIYQSLQRTNLGCLRPVKSTVLQQTHRLLMQCRE